MNITGFFIVAGMLLAAQVLGAVVVWALFRIGGRG